MKFITSTSCRKATLLVARKLCHNSAILSIPNFIEVRPIAFRLSFPHQGLLSHLFPTYAPPSGNCHGSFSHFSGSVSHFEADFVANAIALSLRCISLWGRISTKWTLSTLSRPERSGGRIEGCDYVINRPSAAPFDTRSALLRATQVLQRDCQSALPQN